MSINPWKIINLDKEISWQEIEQKLNSAGNVDIAKYKSIFEEIAGGDGTLSTDEWDKFTSKCDKNKDKNLIYDELRSVYNKSKDEIINLYNFIKDIVNTRTKNTASAKKTENQEQYIDKPFQNNYRAKSSTNGNFTEKWLEQDKYGSKTYAEWTENLAKDGYEFDTDLADSMLNKINTISKTKGKCSKAVADSLSRIETVRLVKDEETGDEEYINEILFPNTNRQAHAYQNASVYANNPHFKELPHNIVSTMDLTQLPKGCIIVYDANYKTSPNAKNDKSKYHKSGHIGITDGTGNDISWGTLRIVQNRKDTKIRVFIPVKQIEE